MSSKNSQCELLIPLLDAYVDNELDVSENEQVSSHIQTCDDCKAQIKEIEKLKFALSQMPRRQMRRDLADDFDAILEAAAGASKVSDSQAESVSGTPSPVSSNVVAMKGKRRWVVAAASAAAVLVVAMAGSIVSRSGAPQVANNKDSALPVAQQQQTAVKAPAIAANDVGANDADREFETFENERRQDNLAADQPASSKPNMNASEAMPKVAHRAGFSDKDDVPARTSGAHLTEDVVADANSRTAVVAHNGGSDAFTGRSTSTELLALYEDDDDSSDIGVMTDEDGLYAIKL